MLKARRGKIGLYGSKTRRLQRCISFEAFGLSMKDALVYLYLGDVKNLDPKVTDIGSTVFFEVPDRAYSNMPIAIPVGMELMSESAMDFSRFGLINPLGDEDNFKCHIDDFVTLGRDLMVGDVFEIPFHSKNGRRALWEVTDVDYKSEMEKYTVSIKASPLAASRKNDELSGIINRTNDDFLIDLEEAQDTVWEEQVPTNDLQFDVEAPAEINPVDKRRKEQADFLDDPSKSFWGD